MNCFLFDGLTKEQLDFVSQNLSKPVKIERGDEIYKNGCIGIINSGKAEVNRNNTNGGKLTIRNMKTGDVFGVASMFGEWQNGLSSITATTDCVVTYVCENTLKELMLKIPQISINYISFLSDRIRYLNLRIDTFGADNVEHKIYEFLCSASDENGNVNLDFGMAELARRLKIGRTSLYRSLDVLEGQNLIKRNKNNFVVYKKTEVLL